MFKGITIPLPNLSEEETIIPAIAISLHHSMGCGGRIIALGKVKKGNNSRHSRFRCSKCGILLGKKAYLEATKRHMLFEEFSIMCKEELANFPESSKVGSLKGQSNYFTVCELVSRKKLAESDTVEDQPTTGRWPNTRWRGPKSDTFEDSVPIQGIPRREAKVGELSKMLENIVAEKIVAEKSYRMTIKDIVG